MKSDFYLPLLFVISLTLCGCWDSDNSFNIPDETYSYNLIWPCDEGYYDFETGFGTEGDFNEIENPQYLTETMFKMLGMLNTRYMEGALNPTPNLLERFPSDSADLADLFEELILQFGDETGFIFEYTREVDTYRISLFEGK